MGPEGPHNDLTLPLFFVIDCLLVSVVAVAATELAKQHKTGKQKKNRSTPPKLCFPRFWGHLGRRGLAKEKPKKNINKIKKNNVLSSISFFVFLSFFLYLILHVFYSSSSLSFPRPCCLLLLSLNAAWS